MKRGCIPTDALAFVFVVGVTCFAVFAMSLIKVDAMTDLSDVAAIFSAFATMVIAVITGISIIVTQKLEKERMRPRVTFDFVFNKNDGSVYAEIRNEGLRLAKDIKVELPAEIEKLGVYGDDDFAFSHPVSFLAPTNSKKTLLMAGRKLISYVKNKKNEEILVKVSYKSSSEEKYSDEFRHNLTHVKHTKWLGSNEPV